METFVAFLVIAAVVIISPGPDTALTIRNTLLGGRRGGIFTAIGVATGQVIWTVATSVGISAVLAASETIFRTVKLVGATYLIFLGVQALYGALRVGGHRSAVDVSPSASRLVAPVAFRQGLVSNLTNPKMAAFFPALLPQFAPVANFAFVVLLLGLLFSSMTLVWLAAYAFVVAKAGDFLRRSRIRRWLEATTGAVLVTLGLRLAIERR